MILRGLRKYAHEMDRLGLGITWGKLPDNRQTTGSVRHQKGARRPSFGDGLHPEPSLCPWCQPFLLRAAYPLDFAHLVNLQQCYRYTESNNGAVAQTNKLSNNEESN